MGGIYGPERDSRGPNTLIKIHHLKHSPIVLHAGGLYNRKSLEEPIWFSPSLTSAWPLEGRGLTRL